MTSSTPDVPRPSNEEQSTKRTFREMTLIRVGLGLGSAFMVQEFASEWGQHLSPTELYPLSLAVGMSFYNLHLLNPIPPNDHRSRLRALWLPQQKKQALGLSFLLFLASVIFFNVRQSREINELQLSDIKALKPIDRGLHKLSGTPQTEENPYRWVFSDNVEPEQAPYLIPLKEYKGQVLVVSQTEFKDPLDQRIGLVSELSSFARPHYVAYRNYMGISPNAPIYLFDIRGLWWFDPQAIAAMIMSALLFMGILGSATRDPDNDSRLLFIPPELRAHLDSDEASKEELDHDHAPTEAFDEQAKISTTLPGQITSEGAESNTLDNGKSEAIVNFGAVNDEQIPSTKAEEKKLSEATLETPQEEIAKD